MDDIPKPPVKIIERPTTYMETLMNFLRANIGTGLFAMGNAIKNSGLILGPILTVLLGFFCVFSEHQLLNASTALTSILGLEQAPDFAHTVELCFLTGPQSFKKFAFFMKVVVNVFLCLTQYGFCCIHLIFVTSSVKQVLDVHGYVYEFHALMTITIVPILIFCTIRNLKRLAPISTFANILLLTGTLMTMFYVLDDFKPAETIVYFATIPQLPLFFGTILYAFEGIGAVIPLKTEMIYPEKFDSVFGVLNVGKLFLTVSYIIIGVLVYLKYGEGVEGSFTLNIPLEDKLAQAVKVLTAIAIMCTYPIQYYVPFQILWYPYMETHTDLKHPLLCEISVRLGLALFTFTLAQTIPHLDLFISLVGAFSSAVLALWIPPILDFIIAWKLSNVTVWVVVKNLFIFTLGLVGAITGSYASLYGIKKREPKSPTNNTAYQRIGTNWWNM